MYRFAKDISINFKSVVKTRFLFNLEPLKSKCNCLVIQELIPQHKLVFGATLNLKQDAKESFLVKNWGILFYETFQSISIDQFPS